MLSKTERRAITLVVCRTVRGEFLSFSELDHRLGAPPASKIARRRAGKMDDITSYGAAAAAGHRGGRRGFPVKTMNSCEGERVFEARVVVAFQADARLRG